MSDEPRKRVSIQFAHHWLVLPADSDVPQLRVMPGPVVEIDDPKLGTSYWVEEVKRRLGSFGPGKYIGIFFGEDGERLPVAPWVIEVSDLDALTSGWTGPNS